MDRTLNAAHRRRLIFFAALTAGGCILFRRILWALLLQVLAAAALMLCALPLCRQLEKKLPGGASAALALAILLLGAALTALAIIPPAAAQMRQLGNALPTLTQSLSEHITRFTLWLESHGLNLAPIRDGLLEQASALAGSMVSKAVGMARGFISGLSKVLLSPLLAFYLLRDRRRIASGLTLLLPVSCRARGVRAAREMKRETSAFLRGQLLISLCVGAMTALGLLLTGTPGWLLLGVLMGILELVPYIGPFIAGVPAVLLALQGGWVRALWTLAVLVVIQEVEGTVLSPRLVGEATSLHPMAVLLLVSAGGMAAGALGMVLIIPLVVSLRGALRGWRV